MRNIAGAVEMTVYSKVLIVGCGAIAIQYHLPRLLAHLGPGFAYDDQLPTGPTVYLYDHSPARREELSAQFQQHTKVVVLAQLPEDESYDLIAICTPALYHRDTYFRLERSSKRFLIEKPLAITADDAREIGVSADHNNRRVFVNLLRRQLSSLSLLRAFWQDQVFGDLRSVSSSEGRVYAWKAASFSFFDRKQSGGGVLMDMGPHVLDQLLQLFQTLDLEEAKIDCQRGAIEANARLQLRGNGRVPIKVDLSRNRNLSNSIELKFDRATCRMQSFGNAIEVESSGRHFSIVPQSRIRSPIDYETTLDNFYYERLLLNDWSGVSPQESALGLEVIEKSYEVATDYEGCF